MDMKLELVAVPVSDVDRAKAFYKEVWRSGRCGTSTATRVHG